MDPPIRQDTENRTIISLLVLNAIILLIMWLILIFVWVALNFPIVVGEYIYL
jgi:p-aminobenzoyl-glutamate transporter AbgT